MRFSTSAAAALALAPLAFAQTYTDCDPTKKDCPADLGLPSSSYKADFTTGSSSNASWSAAAYTTIEYGSDGAVFTIESASQAPTIQTDFYIFFGRVDVVMRAASGQGIVSSIVLESDDLDEIDWEFLGGSPNQVQSNYYGKGNTTSYDRVQYHDVADTQGTWHTYSIDWSSEKIDFLIDSTVVRSLPYGAANGGSNYPQTPAQLKLGNWAGGASKSEGTVEWAGGKTDFTKSPFKMYVKSVSITNANPACSYTYGDRTGSFESIKIEKAGDSCSASGGSSSTASSGSSSGSATKSPSSTVTTAPTSKQSVDPIANTLVAASSTITGSAYSTNIAAISSVNSQITSAVGAAPTDVVAQPTSGINGTTGSGNGASTSSIEASPGSASLNRVTAAGSLLSLALAVFML